MDTRKSDQLSLANVSYRYSLPIVGVDLSSLERERLEKTLDSIPDDICTGLEIGFHDFRITNLLRSKMDLVSIDLPKKVNQPSLYKLTFADLQSLPFRDNTFDIVICTEVLEHLSEDVLLKGVRELQRVSRRYVLVSVPYKQRVWNEMFRCANCGFLYNRMGHLHYMDDQKLAALFEGAISEKSELAGQINGYAPDWLYSLANTLGNAWSDFIFGNCPNCQKSDKAVTPNAIGYVLQRLIWRAERLAKARPAWIITLFKLA
jgi:methyltransferase family protein